MNTEILVCTGCNDWRTKNPGEESAKWGEKLVVELIQLDEAPTTVPCLGACGSSCVVAFREEGKPTYVFGGLKPENAEDVVKLAKIYAEGDGIIAWHERPECMKSQIVKLPV